MFISELKFQIDSKIHKYLLLESLIYKNKETYVVVPGHFEFKIKPTIEMQLWTIFTKSQFVRNIILIEWLYSAKIFKKSVTDYIIYISLIDAGFPDVLAIILYYRMKLGLYYKLKWKSVSREESNKMRRLGYFHEILDSGEFELKK